MDYYLNKYEYWSICVDATNTTSAHIPFQGTNPAFVYQIISGATGQRVFESNACYW